MNDAQRKLVEENTDVVKQVIRRHITVSEHRFGFGYDDLFQEGCLWLCKAAQTYDGARAQFKTYASVVVKNGLLSHCRTFYSRESMVSIDDEDCSPAALAVDDSVCGRGTER
jgi:RNA polymerase sigma factor (sigma-70 family)